MRIYLYYDSSIGRFINEDPVKDGLNWYSYCDSNPIMFYDPSGLVTYIYYGLETWQESLANEDKKMLEGQGEEVELIPVKYAQDFVDDWNSRTMSENDNVIIHTHGSNRGIIVETEELRNNLSTLTQSGVIDENDVSGVYIPDLKQQTLNSITLTACDTGDIDYMHSQKKDNAAVQFMERMNVNYVIAPDARNYTDVNRTDGYTVQTYVYIGKEEKGDYRIKSPINEGYLMYYGNRSELGYYPYKSLGCGPYSMKELLELGNNAYLEVQK